MARSKSNEWEQLKEHARLLRSIQTKLFEQVDKGVITDDIADSKEAANEIMPRVYAIESALVSLGSISSVSNSLREGAGYVKLEDDIQDDVVLRDLSIDYLRDKERTKRFARLFKEHAVDVLTFVENIEKTPITPKPYGGFVDFDMEVWALACLIDIKDVFFRRRIDTRIAEDNKELEKRIETVVSSRLEQIRQEATDGINKNVRVGWYGSMTAMKSIRELLPNKKIQRDLEKQKNLSAALQGVGGSWEALLGKILNHRAVVETILLSTRAVCAFVAIAQDVLVSSRVGNKGGEDVSQTFKDIENDVLRNEAFAQFCLSQLAQYRQTRRLPLEDVDPFIHLTGILAFSLSRGYFSAPDGKAKGELRESLQRDFKDRNEIVVTMLDKYERDVVDLLIKDDSDLYREKNIFVATSDLARLYDEDGNLKSLRTIEDKAEIGGADLDHHTFVYVVALPIAVKALAQLSIGERLNRMAAVNHEHWGELEGEFADWLPRVDALGETLVAAMSRLNIKRSADGNTAWGVWEGQHDWSVTAAVVDALGLWCGALACRAAFNAQTGLAIRPPEKDPDRDPVGPFPASDSRIVAEFFDLVSRRTTPPEREESNGGDNEALLEWLGILRRVSSPALNFEPRSFGSDTERTSSKSLGLENAFKVVALVQYIRQQMNEPLDELVPTVCEHITEVLKLEKAGPDVMFNDLCGRIRSSYPGAFPNQPPQKAKASAAAL
jgi:hypothetical protein